MRDLIAGVVGIALGLIFLVGGLGMSIILARGYPGPSFFPIFFSIVSIASGLILIARYFMHSRISGGKADDRSVSLKNTSLLESISYSARRRDVANVLIFITSVFIYIALISYVGFLLTSLMFMYIVMVIYGVRSLEAAAYSAGITAFVYVLFILVFRVAVPEPILGSILLR